MMLKQELTHSHILVAMFCGWEPQKPNKEFPNGYLLLHTDHEPDSTGEIGGETDYVSNDTILEELPYATDWNYLMAAYDKFRTDVENQENDQPALMDIRDTLIDAILNFNIDLAFKELVRGINTINELKLQES